MNDKFKIFSCNELKNIEQDNYNAIMKYANSEYNKFIYRYKSISKCFNYSPVNTRSVSKKAKNSKMEKLCTYYPYLSLENEIIYRSNSTIFPFEKENEKMLFICSAIFNNNEKFLDNLVRCNSFTLLDELIQNYNYIDGKSEDEHKVSILKVIYYNSFNKKNETKLEELKNYFFNNHKISHIELVINKLFQIYYFDNELYNSYVNNFEETKKLIKK